MANRMGVTLQDIANLAGVTKMTVSLVLNSRQYGRVSAETRRRVEEIARELNYRPNQAARQLTGKRSGILGLLMPRTARVHAFHRLKAVDMEALNRGYRLMAGHTSSIDDSLDAYLDDFETRGVEGIIWMGHQDFADQRVIEAMQRSVPIVMISQPVPLGAHCVMLDYVDAIRQVMAHLVRQGRKRIAIALHAEQWIGNQERLAGYLQGLREAGMQEEEALVWRRRQPDRRESLPDPQNVEQIVQKLAIEQHADAIIANNDIWAADLIRALRQRGLHVPRDVAVVGQDNTELAEHFDPPITSLDLQPTVVARRAMEMLSRVIEGPPLPPDRRQSMVPMKLVPRESA